MLKGLHSSFEIISFEIHKHARQPKGHVFCARVVTFGKTFKTNDSLNGHYKLVCAIPLALRWLNGNLILYSFYMSVVWRFDAWNRYCFDFRKLIYGNGTISIHWKRKHDKRKLNLICTKCCDDISFIHRLESHMEMGMKDTATAPSPNLYIYIFLLLFFFLNKSLNIIFFFVCLVARSWSLLEQHDKISKHIDIWSYGHISTNTAQWTTRYNFSHFPHHLSLNLSSTFLHRSVQHTTLNCS